MKEGEKNEMRMEPAFGMVDFGAGRVLNRTLDFVFSEG